MAGTERNPLLMCALLKEAFASFGSHIVEDTVLPLLAADTIEALCSGAEWAADSYCIGGQVAFN
jgi:hypothetical protein